jgi:hypothetical protein
MRWKGDASEERTRAEASGRQLARYIVGLRPGYHDDIEHEYKQASIEGRKCFARLGPSHPLPR